MKLFSRQALGKCLSDVAVGVGDASEVDAQQRGQRHRTPLNSIEFRNCVVDGVGGLGEIRCRGHISFKFSKNSTEIGFHFGELKLESSHTEP
jgi:hypothetical protein